jgi:hypothetical protein
VLAVLHRALPGRRVAAPLVVATCPPLFLLYRGLTTCGTAAGCSTAVAVAYALAALAGVPVAAGVARAVDAGRGPPWLAPRPDDATLAALAGIVVAVDAYLLASMGGAVPAAVDALATPLGLLLGVPLVVVQVLVVVAGNALGEPSMGVQLLAVAVGVALSAAWWYVLAAGVGRLVGAVADSVGSATDPRD